MQKILLLGGSYQQIIAIETAKRLGLYTILCDYLPDNPGQYHADKFYQISTTDKESVFQIAKDESIDYIIAYASDPAAPTAAYVAEKLHLPTNPYNAVDILCNKDKFRAFLSSHGYNTPKVLTVEKQENGSVKLDDFSFPIIIKPVDSSGSKGVTVLYERENLKAAIEFAFSYSRGHRIIIEEYIEKKHPYLIGGDVFISEGEVIQWGLMNCHRDNRVNPLVPVGKSFPIDLDPDDLQRVKDVLQKIVNDLGIRFGPMNVELIIDKFNRVFPIDIGPRSGGNMIPDLLGQIFNCDEVELSIRAAMGQPIDSITYGGTNCYASYNLHVDRDGYFSHITVHPEIEKYIIRRNIYKKAGDEVHFFSNASDVIGILFFKFPSKEKMIQAEDHMNEYVTIMLQGE